MPLEEFEPTTEAELQRFVAENATGPRRSLFPMGGRTSLFGVPGPDGEGSVVTTSQLDGVVDYPARDMTITVGAGLRIDELSKLLEAEGQRLPVEVAQSQRATLGGVIATNTSGPSRFGHGTIRDHVIGIAAVDGRGRLFHAGGRVVKNVAGYDLCKLLVGSVGTLGIVSTVTLKLKPIPESSRLVWAAFPDFAAVEAALERLVKTATRPVLLDVLDPAAASAVASVAEDELPSRHPVLVAGFEGSSKDTAWQCATLTDELTSASERHTIQDEPARVVRNALVDFRTRSDVAVVFKANLRPSRTVRFVEAAREAGCQVQAHAGNGIVFGHLPESIVGVERASTLLDELRALVRPDGNLVVDDCEPRWQSRLPLWGEPDPEWSLMERLKATFDPHGLLNPGRLPGQEAAIR